MKQAFKNILFSIGYSILALQSFDVSAADRIWKSDVFSTTALKMMKQDLSEFTKILSRDLYVYHWAPLKNMKIRPSSEMFPFKYEKAQKHLERRMKLFNKHHKNLEHVNGIGLYAATNPAASSWYGGETGIPWGMTEIRVPKGSKFLDERLGYDKIMLKEKTYRFMFEKCGFDKYISGYTKVKGIQYVGIHKIAITSKRKCRNIFLQAVEDLGINFFTYLWVENKNYKPFCDRTDGLFDHKGSSILLVNIDTSPRNYNFFTESISGIRMNSYAFSKYKELHDKMKLARPGIYNDENGVWDLFDLYPITTGLEKKLQETTFTCMKQYKEDQIE